MPKRRAVLSKPKFALALAVMFVLSAGRVHAQKMFIIGSLNTADQFLDAFDGFKIRMAELGYREGQNIRYDYYNSKGNAETLKAIAEKLVHDKVDMIVTSATTGAVAAAKATVGTRIPVVFLSAGNPEKLVKSYATSASNLAGISSASVELTGKRFELLKEFAPRTKRIAMPLDPKGVNYQAIVTEAREAAHKLGVVVREIPARTVGEIAGAVAVVDRKNYDAIFTPADTLISEGIEAVVQQAIKEKVPLITSLLVNVKRGCLATYAADYPALGKQGAMLADKIFKGRKPADLPIELPNKINLALNLKTAKAIGLQFSKEMLLRADEVFE
jgi:putative ABC transport system substrate-binding protein